MTLEIGRRARQLIYVARLPQRGPRGNLGKVDNGIVSVINAYGVLAGMTFPLLFKIFKPKGRLQEHDVYKTKLQLAQEIIQELQVMGFKFELVLADSPYGECHPFISVLKQFELKFIVAIRRAPECGY